MCVPKNTLERRIWVCGKLRMRGTSLSKLAKQEGVTLQALSAALSSSSSHLETVIASALGLTAQQLFPERFTQSGERLGYVREKQRSIKKAAEACQKREAA